MFRKDNQIEQMSRQLKNRELAFGFMKKDVEAKMKKIATLESLLATINKNTTTVTIV